MTVLAMLAGASSSVRSAMLALDAMNPCAQALGFSSEDLRTTGRPSFQQTAKELHDLCSKMQIIVLSSFEKPASAGVSVPVGTAHMMQSW